MCNCNRLIGLRHVHYKWRGRLESEKQIFRNIKRLLSSKVGLYGWGSGDSGELGSSNQSDNITSPMLLSGLQNFTSVSCGYATTFLYDKNLKFTVGLGLNTVGQLGNNDSNGTDMLGDILQISCGRSHTVIWSDNGVFATGSNVQGQCGLRKDFQLFSRFQSVPLPFDHNSIKQIECGLDHTLILTRDGKIYATGLGTDGQTGNGMYACQYGFIPVHGEINDMHIKQISTSTDSCLALANDNKIFGWGNNEQGQISRMNQEKQIACPILIDNSTDKKIISQVIAGGSFSAFVSENDVFVTGYGALGLGKETIEIHNYKKIDCIFGEIVKISCGPDYLATLTKDGKLFTWGRGNHGRLGHGNTEDQFIPKMVDLSRKVVDFACGIDHMIAIVADEG